MLDFLNIYFLIYFDRNKRWHFFFIDPIFSHKCYLYFSLTSFSTESFKSLFFLFFDYDFFKWKRRSNDTQFSYCRWCGIWFVPLGYYISAATSEELHLLLLFYLLSCIIPCLAKRKCIRWRIHLGLWSGCVIPLCVYIFCWRLTKFVMTKTYSKVIGTSAHHSCSLLKKFLRKAPKVPVQFVLQHYI